MSNKIENWIEEAADNYWVFMCRIILVSMTFVVSILGFIVLIAITKGLSLLVFFAIVAYIAFWGKL